MSTKVDPKWVFYLALGLGAVYLISKAAAAADSVADGVKHAVTKDLNPASSENIVNRAVEGIGSFFTGDDSWTLGGSIYDWVHRNDNASVERISSMEEINYDVMGNVVGTGITSSDPAFTNEQLWRIGGDDAYLLPTLGQEPSPTFAGAIRN